MKRHEPSFLDSDRLIQALRPHLAAIDPRARAIHSLELERTGGFARRSYILRLKLVVELTHGTRTHWLRASQDWHDHTRHSAWRVMQRVWHDFHHGRYLIAEPIHFFPRWRLLVYREATGTTLREVLHRHPAQAVAGLRSCARWLAAFHGHRYRLAGLAYAGAGSTRYWQGLARIISMSDRERNLVRPLIRRMIDFDRQTAASPKAILVHHDFHPENILLDRSAIHVLDFTDTRMSLPVIDVATFITQLAWQCAATVRPERIAAWQAAFVQEYLRHCPKNFTRAELAATTRSIGVRVALQYWLGARLQHHAAPSLRKLVDDILPL